jgi:hypothetical protein
MVFAPKGLAPSGPAPLSIDWLESIKSAAGTRKRLQEDFHTSRANPESKVHRLPACILFALSSDVFPDNPIPVLGFFLATNCV